MSEKTKKIFEYIYICYLVIVSIDTFLMTTLYGSDDFSRLAQFLFMILEIGIIVKVYYEWKAEWKAKDLILALFTAGVFILSFFKHDLGDVIRLAFLIVGAKNIDYKKIIKVYLGIEVVFFCLTLILCATGVIGNVITYRSNESTHARMSLGFIYATSFSAHVLIIVTCWLFMRNKKVTWIEIALVGILGCVVYYFTEARIASMTLIMLCLGALFAKIFRDKKIVEKIYNNKAIKIGLIGASVWGTVVGVVLGALYNNQSELWKKINHMFSERIISNAKVMHRYPVSLLGDDVITYTNLEQGMDELPSYYFIVNCSYVEILYFFGILGLVSVLTIWCSISYREWKKKNYYCLFIYVSLAIFFFFEQRMIEFTFNPFCILIFSTYMTDDDYILKDMYFAKYEKWIRSGIACLIIAFLAESFVFNFKSIETRVNAPISLDQCDVVTGDFYGNPETSLIEYDYDGDKKSMYIDNIMSYTGLESVTIGLNIMTKEDNDTYQLLDDIEYSVDISNINVETGEIEYLDTVWARTGSVSKTYIPLKIGGASQIMKFDFGFPGDYAFDINTFEFNGKKPFDISLVRVSIITLILFAATFIMIRKKTIDIEK